MTPPTWPGSSRCSPPPPSSPRTDPLPAQALTLAARTRTAAPGGIGLALADAGYCSEANFTCDGPDRLIAVAKRRDLEQAARGQDAGQDRGGPATQAMRERLKTGDGITAYRQRGHIAETPHGHIKHNMGIRQLSMRGKPRASAEWTFICAVQQPVQGPHHRPPHQPSPGRPGRLTQPARTLAARHRHHRGRAPAIAAPTAPPANQFRNSPSGVVRGAVNGPGNDEIPELPDLIEHAFGTSPAAGVARVTSDPLAT